MMERSIIKGLLFSMVIISSCYYDNEEELYPGECVTDSMSLQSNIEPILDRNCYKCHSTTNGPFNGNVILDQYAELVKYANSGQLVGVINYASGFPQMPQGASKLGDCEIAKIESWVDAGALNN